MHDMESSITEQTHYLLAHMITTCFAVRYIMMVNSSFSSNYSATTCMLNSLSRNDQSDVGSVIRLSFFVML